MAILPHLLGRRGGVVVALGVPVGPREDAPELHRLEFAELLARGRVCRARFQQLCEHATMALAGQGTARGKATATEESVKGTRRGCLLETNIESWVESRD